VRSAPKAVGADVFACAQNESFGMHIEVAKLVHYDAKSHDVTVHLAWK
jgi:hypothetical protein